MSLKFVSLRFALAFKEGWRGHRALCGRQPDIEGGRQYKSDGVKVDRNRLGLGQSSLGLLGQRGKGGIVTVRDLREHLAVDFDASLAKAIHESAVR